MPTGTKLFAGLVLAVVAMIASEFFKPQMPVGTDFGYFTLVNGFIALVLGWRLIGARAGKGIVSGINNGVAGGVCLVFVTLFAHSFRLMLINSTNLRYQATSEALQDVVRMMVEFGALMLTSEIVLTLSVGSVAIGILCEYTVRRWR